MAKAKKVSKIKIKKKLWFKVISPKTFGMKEIGQSYLPSVETAVGRSMKVNLKNLTNSVRDQNANIVFLINKVDGGNLQTSTIGYELTAAYVKRMVRKNTNKLEDYFVLKTRTGQEVILKTLVVTLGRAQRSTRSSLRKLLEEFMKKEVGKSDFETFVSELVSRKTQAIAKKTLQKIHPIKEVAVRVLKLKDFSTTKAVADVKKVDETEKVEEVEKVEAKEEAEVQKDVEVVEEQAESEEQSEESTEEATEDVKESKEAESTEKPEEKE